MIERLIDNFDLLADAPNGVSELRKMILQLAVQGKLVSQDPNDEPASELLKKIKIEKEKLIQEGILKAQKPLPSIKEDEIPFILPEGWQWVRMGEIQEFVNGYAFKSREYENTGIGIVRIGDIQNGVITTEGMKYIRPDIREELDDKLLVNPGDLVIALSGATTGKLGFNNTNQTFLLNQRVGKINLLKIEPMYVYSYLTTKIKENLRISAGSAIPNLSTSQINNTLFPLPPIAEQKRIVAKVDQLMALCDELESKQQEYNEKRLSVNASCLHLLTTASIKTQPMAEKRLFNNFDNLYTHPQTVTELKKAILQLAVQGKLVQQDPNDEPAYLLLEKIKVEKERLIKEGKIKKQKPFVPINEEDAPYTLPTNWVWMRFGKCVHGMTNGIYKPAKYYAEDGIICLRMYNIADGKINFEKVKRMILTEAEVTQYALETGDLLVNRVNSRELVGKAAVIPVLTEPVIFESKNIRVKFIDTSIDSKYVSIFFQTREVRTVFEGDAKQTCGQASISQPQIGNLALPLPPLAEQKRIVAKVDQLMALCDELEARLAQAQEDSESLAASIVYHLCDQVTIEEVTS